MISPMFLHSEHFSAHILSTNWPLEGGAESAAITLIFLCDPSLRPRAPGMTTAGRGGAKHKSCHERRIPAAFEARMLGAAVPASCLYDGSLVQYPNIFRLVTHLFPRLIWPRHLVSTRDEFKLTVSCIGSCHFDSKVHFSFLKVESCFFADLLSRSPPGTTCFAQH